MRLQPSGLLQTGRARPRHAHPAHKPHLGLFFFTRSYGAGPSAPLGQEVRVAAGRPDEAGVAGGWAAAPTSRSIICCEQRHLLRDDGHHPARGVDNTLLLPRTAEAVGWRCTRSAPSHASISSLSLVVWPPSQYENMARRALGEYGRTRSGLWPAASVLDVVLARLSHLWSSSRSKMKAPREMASCPKPSQAVASRAGPRRLVLGLSLGRERPAPSWTPICSALHVDAGRSSCGQGGPWASYLRSLDVLRGRGRSVR